MPWWDDIISHLETRSRDPNGLLLSNGTAQRGDAVAMVNAALIGLAAGAPGGLTTSAVAKAMSCDRAVVNSLAARNNADLLAPTLAMEIRRGADEYLVSAFARGRTGGEMRGGELQEGPVGVHNRPGWAPHESLAGWTLVVGGVSVAEALAPLLKGTVDDPQIAEELVAEHGIAYTPRHGLPVELDELMQAQLVRVGVAEDAVRSLAHTTMAAREEQARLALRRADRHASLPLLVDVIPFGFVRQRGLGADPYPPAGHWYAGLDRAFLEGLDREGPWAALAFRFDVDELASGVLERIVDATNARRYGPALVAAFAAGDFDGEEVSPPAANDGSRVWRVRDILVQGARFDLLVHLSEHDPGTAWAIRTDFTDAQSAVLARCLRQHLDLGASGRQVQAAVTALVANYGLLKIQAPKYEVRAFLRALALGAHARRVATA